MAALGELLADNYVTFGVLLSGYLMVPSSLGLRRGVPAWARGAGAAAVAMIAVILASLALGLRPPELYFSAIFLSYALTIITELPYRRREPYLYEALLIASTAIMTALILLFQRMFFLGAS